MSEKNVDIIKRMFEAFGRRDITAVLGMFSEDIEFQSPVTRVEHVEISWSRPRKGREQVAQFFKELAEKVQPEPFEVVEIIAQGDKVVVEGRNRGSVRSTGSTYEHDWVMIFTLRDGKIAKIRHYYDTADVSAAFPSK
jgi:ketosteroid isomerase-like protein